MKRAVTSYIGIVSIGVFLATLGILCWQCDGLGSRSDSTVVARVGHQSLYDKELSNLTTVGKTPAERQKFKEAYIKNWVEQRLLMEQATQEGAYDQQEVERKVQQYRYALIAHQFIEKKVQERLDRNVTDAAMAKYYQAHTSNFILPHPIVQGKLVVVPKRKNNAKVQRWITSSRPKDLEELAQFCEKSAQQYRLDATQWLRWDEITKDTPFSNIKNVDNFLKKTEHIRRQQGDHVFYLKIDQYKLPYSSAPLDYVKEKVRTIMLYKRQRALAKKIKEEIIHNAQQQKAYVIYDHETQDQ